MKKCNHLIKKILIMFLFVLCSFSGVSALEGQTVGGIGAGLINIDGVIKINTIIANSPAEKAGLKKGDLILEINNEKISDLNGAVSKLRGKIGTNVKLLIKRDDTTKEYNISRGSIFISDYMQIGEKAYFYLKYLKYENGVYYFWTKELYGAWGKNYNKGYKDYYYSKNQYAIDLKNGKCALVSELGYDKNDDILYNNDFSDNLNYMSIAPNTFGYIFYVIIEKIDHNELKNKYSLNGYIDLYKILQDNN